MNSLTSGINSRGALIVIEGCDRTGKTTQSKKLVEVLKNNGIQAKYMNFPARDIPSGILIDSYIKSKTTLSDESIHLLFSANRWELAQQLENDLINGITIVVDRYSFSGIAYSVAKGMDYEWCKNPEKGLIKPDLVLYLAASIDVLSNRKDFGLEIYEKVEFQKKVDGIFKKLCQEENNYFQKINANVSIDELHKKLVTKTLNIIDKVKQEALQKLWV